jgi:hypothetical protein
MTLGYAKVFRRVWRDERLRALTRNDKLTAIYLLSGQSNRLGYFALSVALAAEDLGIDIGDCRESIRRVCATLGWPWDEETGVLLISTWWKWNHPPNYDALKGYLTDLEDVPRSPLLVRFVEGARFLGQRYRPIFTKAIERLDETVLETVGNTVSDIVSSSNPSQTNPNQTKKEPGSPQCDTPTVPQLVEKYRALDGIKPSRRDGKVIAGLVRQYGAAFVWQVIDDDAPSLVAADSPLLLLAARCKRAAKDLPRQSRPSVDEIERRERDVH